MTATSPRPLPSSENARRTMQANRRVSGRELEMRAAVWRTGARGYRVHSKLPGRPDLAFPGVRLAVFVHGCFWHRCPSCSLPTPKANREFWEAKFAENLARDDRVVAELRVLGWDWIVIWEHEDSARRRCRGRDHQRCRRRETSRACVVQPDCRAGGSSMTDGQFSPTELEPVVENIRRQVSLGITPSDAARQLYELLGDPAKVRAGLAEYLRRVGAIRWLREPATLDEPGLPTWYAGPCESDDCNWPALRRVLVAEEHWDPEDLTSLGHASDKILSRLHPRVSPNSTRRPRLGHVQSGKTANYSAVIAKAADTNYRLFIVLSGIHEGLRRQTQGRLEDQICRQRSEDWVSLTSTTNDFARRTAPRADFFLTDHHDHRVLLVVKKNQARLRGLIAWLRSARPNVLAACPILVIDDEADQASVNASTDVEGRTRINNLIIDLIQTPPKVAYVGYTATPFANLLIDTNNPEDLYPRDFIVDLPRPAAYSAQSGSSVASASTRRTASPSTDWT